LADLIVVNRTCLCWTIKSNNFINGQNRPIFARQTTDFCGPILLADKIGQLYRSSDTRFTVALAAHTGGSGSAEERLLVVM